MDEILDIDIWSSNSKADNQSTIAPLNSLIELLTSDMHYDTNFMKSFICTYQSFTTPTQLFTKLKQRFTYPPSIQVQRGASIQMRVCVVLKYWVQVLFFFFFFFFLFYFILIFRLLNFYLFLFIFISNLYYYLLLFYYY